MKDKKLVVVSVIIGILFVLLLVLGVYAFQKNEKKASIKPTPTPEPNYQTAPDGTKTNDSEMFNINRTFEGFSFENIRLTQYDTEAVFEADCTNQTGQDQGPFKVALIMLDQEGREGNEIMVYIQSTRAGETTHVYTATHRNIVNAYDFKIKRTY